MTPKAALQRPQIVCENPQVAPKVTPGYRVNVKLSTANRTNSVYETMPGLRNIEQLSGDCIIESTKKDSAASHLLLAAPPTRGGFEAGMDGSVLRIVSTCNFKHQIDTPLNTINGTGSRIVFGGIGSITLFAGAAKWIVLASSNVEVE